MAPSIEVRNRCQVFELNNPRLHEMMSLIEQDFVKGLAASNTTIKMLPTFIRAIAEGTELGQFLSLDLGGTNFCVLLITLEPNRRWTVNSQEFFVPEEIQQGTGNELFGYIAKCLADFMEAKHLNNQANLPLGFTFSFPCEQRGLASAVLTNWTKGFKASGVVDKDIVQLLSEACKRRGLDIDVVVVLNDTTGTLMACSFAVEDCYIRVIVGTGCNAAYMEKLANGPKLTGILNQEEDGLPPEICVNTEWGGFGDDGVLGQFLTLYDDQLDKHSINPGRHRFEKEISGMYMGEIVRLVLVDLTKNSLLFSGDLSSNLSRISKPSCFPSKLVSAIEGIEHDENQFKKIEEKLQEIGISNSSAADCANVAYVCSLVSTRAAHFCACGIAALLMRMQRPNVTIGVDGSVICRHPTFNTLLDKKIKELIEGQYKFELVLSLDGSGRGAAVAAAVASRMNRITNEHRELRH